MLKFLYGKTKEKISHSTFILAPPDLQHHQRQLIGDLPPLS